jgi:hypothetical protein
MSAVTAASEFDLTKHVNYTAGMILGVDDFTQEFAYLSGRDRWMAREALGYGTVSGLGIRTGKDGGDYQVMVEPGVAISPRGQLICVPTAQCAYLNQWLAAAKPDELDKWILPFDTSPPVVTSPGGGREVLLYVVLCYRDCLTDNAPIPGEPCRNENELMAASRVKDDFSLELRFEPPAQPEEDAVRAFSDFLKAIEISNLISSTPVDEFLDAIRREFQPSGPASSSPPAVLRIHPEDVAEYMRLAFRLWTTELRIPLGERETGCAVEMTGAGNIDDCLLLAELRVPLEHFSAGWLVSDESDIVLSEDRRPFLLHLRMLQEWMLNEPNDHGDLTGLADDDHKQYLLINGSRAMTGNLKMGNRRITNLAPGIDPKDAVNFEQAVKVNDAAGGDLGGKYPNPTIAKLQNKEVSAAAPLEGQILLFKTNKWITAFPVTDHGDLTGLADDDHKQYLPLTGSRPMSGELKLGNNKITGLAAGTANGNAVVFEQTVKVGDAAGGDLGGTYPNPTIAKLLGKTLGAAPSADGQVLTFRGGNWVSEAPAAGGVTDHSALTGLTNDDHKQYLPLTGSRQMTGALKLGNNKITGLAAGTVSTDAVNFGQVVKTSDGAGGDLTGTFAALSVAKLQGKPLKTTPANAGDALTWTGTEWAPAKPPAAVLLNNLPLATITRLEINFYEVWFHLDAPKNLAAVRGIETEDDAQTFIVVEGENNAASTFLERIPSSISSSRDRNVFFVKLGRPEMNYMRFTFNLGKITVKVEGVAITQSLAAYARNNQIRFIGSEKEETATYFVRLVDLAIQ